MEILFEIVVELGGGFVLVGIGYAGGTLVFLLVRTARLALRHLQAASMAVDPAGGHWSVRVALAPPPIRYALSRRFFGMRPSDQSRRIRQGHGADSVQRDELAHPSGLVEQFDEASGLFVWSLLALTVVAFAVLFLELVVVAVVAGVVFVFCSLRGSWQCEVVGPDDMPWHVPAGRLADARAERDRIRESISSGRSGERGEWARRQAGA